MQHFGLTMAAFLCSIALGRIAPDPPHANGSEQMSIQKSEFGKTPDGSPVEFYTLTNKHGMMAKVMTYGAILTELHVPDRSGRSADIVLGFGDLKDYIEHNPFFGATAGRYANRVANASFELDGKTYRLFANNGPNSLHGGRKGFDKVIWKPEPKSSSAAQNVKFTYLSRDGEEGYPGNLTTTCTYTLADDNSLKIEFMATTDKPTVVNLANHSYFNLGGEGSGSILDEVLTINAAKYTVVNDQLIPTGEIASVYGTPLDFTRPTPIGQRIDQVKGGYDHNYVLNGPAGKLSLCARVADPKTGRVMEIFTTQPGVQLYTANFLDGNVIGVGGKPYGKHAAFCLETQHFPDSPHHPNFPSTVLRPGQKYDEVTVYRFSTE